MLLEISLALMVILFVTSCYSMWNLTIKQEMLEDWIAEFITVIEKINVDLKQIDHRGSFEADDEVGTIFEQIKDIIKQLDRFRGEEQ